MLENNRDLSAPGSVPDHYQEVLHWILTEKPALMMRFQIAGLVLFVLFGLIFFGIAVRFGWLPHQITFGWSDIGLLIAAILLTMVLHELVHGSVMRLFGARPIFGVLWKQLSFYATTPGAAYRRNQYLLVALAPFLVLSAGVILGMGLLSGTFWVMVFAVCGGLNASGAVGDMWMARTVLRYPTSAYVVDERDGIRVFLLVG